MPLSGSSSSGVFGGDRAVDRCRRARVGGELDPGADGADVALVEELRVGQGDLDCARCWRRRAWAVTDRGQRRVVAALGAALEAQGQLRLEAERGALADLEAVGDAARWLRSVPRDRAPSTAFGSQLVGLRVKPGRSSVDPHVAQVQRDARAGSSGSDRRRRVTWAVSGSRLSGGADDDVAEVEGAGDRRGDDRQAQSGAPL